MTSESWRLLVTEAADGATNMAIDEVLWKGRRAGTAPPTLRFYEWAPPTVSLGYGQSLDHELDQEVCRALGVAVVRRPTGGSAIYNDGPERELTHSVAATNDDLGIRTDLHARASPRSDEGGARARPQVDAEDIARPRSSRLIYTLTGKTLTGRSRRCVSRARVR